MLLKACKNPSELAAMRACHLRDGAAVVEFLSFLDAHYAPVIRSQGNDGDSSAGAAGTGGAPLSEVQIADELQACRARCEEFIGPSFATIAGVGENGAIIHYR